MSRYETDDDDPTASGFHEAPTYEHAPPTLEMRPSPFHPMASATPTAPGMPAPFAIDPVITSKPVSVVAPRIVGVPEVDLAGPTEPEGHALDSGETTTDPGLGSWVDAGPTDVSGLPRALRPVVPPPDAPKIEISQSLMLESEDVKTAVQAAKAKTLAAKKSAHRRRHVPQEGPGPAAPTYQMLPALKRKKDDEGSDWPLIVGLVVLALLIAALVGVGAYFAVRSTNVEPPPVAAP